jgi:hypothetical protein
VSGALLALLLLAAGGEDETPPSPKGSRPLLVVMNDVVDCLFPKLLAPPSPEARRLSVRDGLVGVGAYDARGWADTGFTGFQSPPLQLFPRAGAGNSLNADPVTGRNPWNNMP